MIKEQINRKNKADYIRSAPRCGNCGYAQAQSNLIHCAKLCAPVSRTAICKHYKLAAAPSPKEAL